MPESQKHIKLVELIERRVLELFTVEPKLLQVEKPSGYSNLPPKIGDGRPDLFYCFSNEMIIGEAKTEDDVLTEHTELQLKSYFEALNFYDGKKVFIMAVPWKMRPSANNLIKRIMDENDYHFEYLLIDELK